MSGVAHYSQPPTSHLSASSPPRRRTLCTDDGSDLVPPQLPFFVPPEMESRLAPSSRRKPRQSGPIGMSIDVQLADSGHKIRPLPRLPIPPSPKSAPPVPHQQLVRNAYSATSPTPVVASNTHLSPPCPRPGPPRFTSLSLKVQTSPDALQPYVFSPSPLSPPTPTIPEPPSPRTAQRKRISKLRRHLGESVQMQLCPDTVDVLAQLRHAGKADLYPDTVEKVLDLEGTDSDMSSECDDDEDEGLVEYWEMQSAQVPPKRVSQKWVRERGKNRWTEDNFAKVLQDLRAL
ncbi:hypothetical protein C8R43DRAFT_972273 [Mycena crocata]|nr:hypothetical protein C8R43DRAFT_972273 [Mycena crocata]